MPRLLLSALWAAMALQKEARFVASEGDWYLFESRLPLVPIDADDAPLPVPHPPTLRKELREVASGIRAAEEASGAPADPN